MHPRASEEDLQFVSENQKMAGFSGRITRAIAKHQPDMQEIASSARRFNAQVPGEVKRAPRPRITRFGDHPGHTPINRLAILTLGISLGSRPQKVAADAYRLELEQRLHAHLNKKCVLTRKGRKIFVDISGDFTEAQLEHLARGVKRVWEWEAA